MVDDLAWWSVRTPDAPALIATHDDEEKAITWRGLAEAVTRYDAALADLGVGRGDVVAVQLPNWWQAPAIALAVWRRGAVLAPVMTSIRDRELERMLAWLGASVVVTTGTWDGHDHARTLWDLAPRLPRLRHQVVLAGERIQGQIDFGQFFDRAVHPDPGEPATDPDALALIFFTSGTTGEPKAALRTQNTIYAQGSTLSTMSEPTARRVYTPQSLMHVAALCVLGATLAAGGTMLLTDKWEPSRVADLIFRHEIELIIIVPSFLEELLDAMSGEGRRMALRTVISIASAISADLLDRAAAVLGLPVMAMWGMTEGGTLNTHVDDPADWARYSVGRPSPATEFTLRPHADGSPVDEDRPGRLLMRGASVCLATLGKDNGALDVLADRDDGWYDTGDLAVADGRGGIRLVGRSADRIGGSFMIPVVDVEDAIRTHPDVDDVAIVGHHGGAEGCAVVVGSPSFDLAVLQRHLGQIKMTRWYWPTRVELVDSLPRNAMGKVEKAKLRAWVGDRFPSVDPE